MTAIYVPKSDPAMTRTLALGSGGLSVAVKECLDIAGLTTRCGSAALADMPPVEKHAQVVTRLLDADCRIIGTANMHELAFGVTGINVYLGTPVNPNWPDRIPGGSSSGSAVLVARGLRFCAWHGYGRVGADARRLLRAFWDEADLWSGEPSRSDASAKQS